MKHSKNISDSSSYKDRNLVMAGAIGGSVSVRGDADVDASMKAPNTNNNNTNNNNRGNEEAELATHLTTQTASNKETKKQSILPRITGAKFWAWVLPILLIVPNIGLSYTEAYSIWARIANIVLPLGIYYVIMSLARRTGIPTLCLIPIMAYCAFQIVLLFLYKESIIAIDMFMNVVTTNASEAGELLGSLWIALLVIFILYLPPIVWGIIAVRKRKMITETTRTRVAVTGTVLSAIGAVLVIVCYLTNPAYTVLRHLFPTNVISNMFTTVERYHQSRDYFQTSKDFTYNAVSTRAADDPEVYIMVIGETSRAGNWQLMGYDRETNPELSQKDVIAFPFAMTECNTTHKSVPMLMSFLVANSFGDSITRAKSLFEAFNTSGYETAYISNQARNHSFIDYYGEEAQHYHFCLDDNPEVKMDEDLIPEISKFLHGSEAKKKLVVVHTYGSHFNYRDRYPREFAKFQPDDNTTAEASNREQLVNCYDNSILYIDHILASIINELDSLQVPSAMLYVADHGEDIFDDSRERFLHASPTPTFYQLHVPFLLWFSDEYQQAHPDLVENARMNTTKDVSSTQAAFQTLLAIAALQTPYYYPEQSLCDDLYTTPERLYLNDYNEGVDYYEAGLKELDFEQLQKMDHQRTRLIHHQGAMASLMKYEE